MTSAVTTNTALLAPHTPSTTAAKMPLVLRLRPALKFSNSITNFSPKHNHATSPFASCSFAARLSTPWLRNTVMATATATATGNVWCASGRGLTIRCKVTRSGESGYSPLSSSKSSANWSDRPPTEMAPLFPGCDYEHWLIVMDPPNGGNATKEEMIDYYIKTLAKVLGSEEAAKKSIYNVSCERYYGFGCQIDEETSTKLEGLPGVCFVLPDSYVDVENKDYGAELLVDGKIVERSPERQRRVTPQPQRNNSDRPRYNDRTRYVRRRENQSQGR